MFPREDGSKGGNFRRRFDPEMFNEKDKPTGGDRESGGVETSKGLDRYNEGQISLERFLEIGWPFGGCDISLKVLWAADSSSDSRRWHAIQTTQYISKE